MAEFPALPLWTDAYMGDTSHLTTIEHGAYLLLLIVAWRSRDTRLPDDDRLLARYAKMTPAQWRRTRPIIEPFFDVEGGYWVQGRLTDEANAVRQLYESRAAAGRASALKRKGRHSTKRQRSVNAPIAPIPTPIEKEPTSVGSKKPRKVAAPLKPNWNPKPCEASTKCGQIIAAWPDDRYQSEVEAFRAHHGSRATCMIDWQQAWQTWVLNSAKFDKGRMNGNANGTGHNRTTAAAERAFGPADQWSDSKPF